MKHRERLEEAVNAAIENFPKNDVCHLADIGELQISDYHSVLKMIFHQTFEGPATFALAGAYCRPGLQRAKDYLFHHADEEKSHWQWILEDLRNTGYGGTDPRTLFPGPACQAYIAFNYYVAMRMPIARLAIAAVLEGIGARFGGEYGRKICKALRLEPKQASFFLNHGETDQSHIHELWEIIDCCDLTDDEWEWMHHTAPMAGIYYKSMYAEAGQK